MLRLALSQSLRFMCESKPVDRRSLPAAVTASSQISIRRSSAWEDPARATRIAHGELIMPDLQPTKKTQHPVGRWGSPKTAKPLSRETRAVSCNLLFSRHDCH